jgi:Cu/Ag efflux protein CusF
MRRRSEPHRMGRRSLSRLAALALLPSLALVACDRQRPADLPPADHVYEGRGVVYEVVPTARGWTELVIHHQAIPEFVSREGEVTGMDSMTMPFRVADEVSLEGVSAGNPVEFRFEIRWQGEPALLITSLERLPPGTEIDFGPGAEVEPAPEHEEVSGPPVEPSHEGH